MLDGLETPKGRDHQEIQKGVHTEAGAYDHIRHWATKHTTFDTEQGIPIKLAPPLPTTVFLFLVLEAKTEYFLLSFNLKLVLPLVEPNRNRIFKRALEILLFRFSSFEIQRTL